ncbi:response regulator [Geomonas oryzisoli]|uniref:Response regulator n=1 Tax=Geomonas oryzisoli TaxID=2847992 RepID=A0ABX8JBL4_9BACT|nr:response regulator [Geomonas oryzisoli]QWV94541.1 response regulator [Geomonas oryzisoli]
MKIPLGQLLVQSGIITVKTLDRALARQQGCGLRLGEVLLEMGVITAEELREALGQQAQALAEMKVLLVDDPAAMNCDVEGALKKEGYQVFIARDGVEGLKIAFSQKPDLILCDATSPRMDGYALMRAIKANPASAGTPMILLTSKASPEEEHRALKAGFHDFIAKPVMTIRVVSRVKRAFEIMDKYREPDTAPPA